MKILITNDDGILSPVLPLLIRWARKHGEVTALAPKVEQSGKSHSIEFHRQIEIKEISLAQDVCVYSVDSSPADCVRFGVLGLKQKYDLVLSGINRGYNLGDDIVYSGTVGAIFEAARLGMRGLAVSTDPDNLLASLSALDTLWEYIEQNRLFEECPLYNINIPPSPKGTRITRQGGMFFTDGFERVEGDMFMQIGEPVNEELPDPYSDIAAIGDGFVSVTPLNASRTHAEVFRKLNPSANKA